MAFNDHFTMGACMGDPWGTVYKIAKVEHVTFFLKRIVARESWKPVATYHRHRDMPPTLDLGSLDSSLTSEEVEEIKAHFLQMHNDVFPPQRMAICQ